MQRRSILPVFFSLALVYVPGPTASAAADDSRVAGSWKWSWTDSSGNVRNRELKIRSEGGKLSGIVVGDEGRETAVEDIRLEGDTLKVRYKRTRNGQEVEVTYEGKVAGDAIEGTGSFGGQSRAWSARRQAAPAAAKDEGKGWIDFIKGTSPGESGWKLRPGRPEDEKHKNGWSIKDGVLTNKPAPGTSGIDVYHEKNLKDFELHVEFNVPRNSNSGVYLRGCYEVQVEDTHGRPPANNICGAIYGQQAVSENAAKPAGEWQTFDITLKDNRVTVIHNGKKVIDAFEVKGKTGGPLDDKQVKHGEPGPLMLQGDHGEVHYRNIRIRPLATSL